MLTFKNLSIVSVFLSSLALTAGPQKAEQHTMHHHQSTIAKTGPHYYWDCDAQGAREIRTLSRIPIMEPKALSDLCKQLAEQQAKQSKTREEEKHSFVVRDRATLNIVAFKITPEIQGLLDTGKCFAVSEPKYGLKYQPIKLIQE